MLSRKVILWVAVAMWAAGLSAIAASRRIDLVEFGRVVELDEQPVPTTEKDELVRGMDGWDAVRGDKGEYTIGVEWDEPRDIAEVNIEFRHAIANRELIRTQYWQDDAEGKAVTGSQPAKGRWLTPKAEWWAGDRDVSFAFAAEDREADSKQAGKRVRRTTRIRFLCGKDDLPPVRYLRAYGPDRATEDTFDIRFDPRAKLAPPASVAIDNGFVLASDGKTTMQSAVIQQDPGTLRIRYALAAGEAPNATRILFKSLDEGKSEVKVDVIEAAQSGLKRMSDVGLVIERRGGKLIIPNGAAGRAGNTASSRLSTRPGEDGSPPPTR